MVVFPQSQPLVNNCQFGVSPVNNSDSDSMTFTLNTHITSFTQLAVCIYQLSGHRLQYFLKNPLFSLFFIEKPVTKFDHAVLN